MTEQQDGLHKIAGAKLDQIHYVNNDKHYRHIQNGYII